jgi:hypothetical protein
MMSARDILCPALLVLLGGCATGGSSGQRPQEGSYARYQDGGAGRAEPQAEGGCRPLMAPLIKAFDPDQWGRFGSEVWETKTDEKHSCWNRVWEVPTAVVVYPAVAGIMIILVSSPVWVPLLLLL